MKLYYAKILLRRIRSALSNRLMPKISKETAREKFSAVAQKFLVQIFRNVIVRLVEDCDDV
jgi:hypothetical protein